jgi:diadenosine tetraphosphatase ApaH/serine/threonine PP2A family protein phosphatase
LRIAVLSDIHGNKHALEAVLEAVAGERVDEVWCLGDVVGYGADPDACCALVREHADVCLAGNHDLAATGGLPLDEFSRNAAVAAAWTSAVAEPEHLEWLRGLAPAGRREGIGLFHGSPRDPVWEYVVSDLLAELSLDAMGERLGLVGHSHVALAFVRDEGEPVDGAVRTDGDSADLATGRWLLNPGSVGQPRDGDPRAAWLLLDTDVPTARWARVPYDVAGAQAAIRAAELPEALADRLEVGQ